MVIIMSKCLKKKEEKIENEKRHRPEKGSDEQKQLNILLL